MNLHRNAYKRKHNSIWDKVGIPVPQRTPQEGRITILGSGRVVTGGSENSYKIKVG